MKHKYIIELSAVCKSELDGCWRWSCMERFNYETPNAVLLNTAIRKGRAEMRKKIGYKNHDPVKIRMEVRRILKIEEITI